MNDITKLAYTSADIKNAINELEDLFEQLLIQDAGEYQAANDFIQEYFPQYPNINFLRANVEKVSTLVMVDAFMMLKWREKLANFTTCGPSSTVAIPNGTPTLATWTTFQWGDSNITMDDVLDNHTDIQTLRDCLTVCEEALYQDEASVLRLPDNYPMDMVEQYDALWYKHDGPDMFDFDKDMNRFFVFMRDATLLIKKAEIQERILKG